jgi:hypothetical protein
VVDYLHSAGARFPGGVSGHLMLLSGETGEVPWVEGHETLERGGD